MTGKKLEGVQVKRGSDQSRKSIVLSDLANTPVQLFLVSWESHAKENVKKSSWSLFYWRGATSDVRREAGVSPNKSKKNINYAYLLDG